MGGCNKRKIQLSSPGCTKTWKENPENKARVAKRVFSTLQDRITYIFYPSVHWIQYSNRADSYGCDVTDVGKARVRRRCGRLHCGLIIVSRSRGRTCFGFGVEARRVLESGGGEGQAAALPQAVLQHRLELGAQADHPARRRRPVTGHWTAGWFSCLNSRLHFKLDACNVICGFPVVRWVVYISKKRSYNLEIRSVAHRIWDFDQIFLFESIKLWGSTVSTVISHKYFPFFHCSRNLLLRCGGNFKV